MCLSKLQILYCILGIYNLELRCLIDKGVALSISRNLLSEYAMLLDSDECELNEEKHD